MSFVTDHILSWVTFLPLLGAIVILLVMSRHAAAAFWTAIVVAVADLVLSLVLWFGYDPGPGTDQFTERVAWFMDRSCLVAARNINSVDTVHLIHESFLASGI